MNTKSLNAKERKAQRLLNHYATCERLARYLGHPDPDGKRISVVLWKAEQLGQKRALGLCNTPNYGFQAKRDYVSAVDMVRKTLGVLPPGFFVNSDPRGYALRINGDNEEGKKLIDAVGLQQELGGDGVLSPTIDGSR